MSSNNIEEIREIINQAQKIAVLTGAGVSTDSGIPDFQTFDKNWNENITREEAMSIWFFLDEPQRFWDIYRIMFGQKIDATFNSFHTYLAELDKTKNVKVITQNIDNLHYDAGSTDVIECHGNIKEVICVLGCQRIFAYSDYMNSGIPMCSFCGKVLKPNISLFGEGINGYGEARDFIVDSDLMIVAGTSLNVGPFNELPLVAELFNSYVGRVWLNREDYPDDYDFTHEYKGELSSFVSAISG